MHSMPTRKVPSAMAQADSIMAMIAGVFVPVFEPLGLGDWRIVTALISGFMAKESVVSTINVLFGSKEMLESILSPLAALSFLTFCLLYTPCVAAIASIRRELGRGWSALVVLFQCVLAWVVSFLVYFIGGGFRL